MADKMKLTQAQQHVVDKMSDGWELGVAHSIGNRSCWLQQGGIGESGKSEDIRYSTLEVLFRKDLIEQNGRRNGAMTFKLVKEIL